MTAATIRYGKGQVSLYRTYARPLQGLTPIPESLFTGRENTLFAVDVDVEVFGANFLPAYTHGDNSNVVATDTMKNFILTQALAFEGATLEGFLSFLGLQFLTTYPHMESLRLTGTEQPFVPALVPAAEAGSVQASAVLFSRAPGDRATAVIEVARGEQGIQIMSNRSGRIGLHLAKLTGSSFAGFVHDTHTTLPERADRALVISLDVFWRYDASALSALGADVAGYVDSQQVRDLVLAVTHEFVSKSIQNLVYEIGTRMLSRFPQLAEVSFEAHNLLWDTFTASETDPRVKVYCDPRPPYGMIFLTLSRSDAAGERTA